MATDLGLIQIDVMTVVAINDSPLTIADLLLKHPELFQGIGMLRNQQVRLHIDCNVKPVVLPHRRVPFYLQQMVGDELKALLEQGIIEKADGPTSWVLPIVIQLKSKDPNNVRICTDKRSANEAILRTP